MPALLDRRIDALRASEDRYVDAESRVHLDYPGTCLPARAKFIACTARMHGRCFGYPYPVSLASASPPALTGRHVNRPAEYLLGGLGAPRHGTGEPMISVHRSSDTWDPGGEVVFSLLDPHGTLRDVRDAKQAVTDAGFCVRTGCRGNPGAAEAASGPVPWCP
jgi:hypothetical protein